MRNRRARCVETSEPKFNAQEAGFVGLSLRHDCLEGSQHPAHEACLQNVIGLRDKEL